SVAKHRQLLYPLSVLRFVGITLVQMSLFAFCLTLLPMIWGESMPLSLPELTWRWALAWIIGLVVPGAPGGIGVRAFALFFLFKGVLSDSLAVSVFLALRVANILGDLT